MSENSHPGNIHPRTQEMHTTWRLRDQQRRQAKNQATVIPATSEMKVAKVVAKNFNGDVQIDRFTGPDGTGEWFSPVSGRTPDIGQAVMYTYVEGAPIVMGSAMTNEGEFTIRPDSNILVPSYVSSTAAFQELPDFSNYVAIPQLEVDADYYPVRLGAPPRFDPHYIWWYDHFFNVKNWNQAGNGSLATRAPSAAGGQNRSHIARLRTGGTNGNRSAMFITTVADDHLLGRRDLYEMLFLLQREQSTPAANIWIGGAENVSADPWVGGAFFFLDSPSFGVTRVTAIVRNSAGTDLYNSVFTDDMSDTEALFRIRTELIPGAPTPFWRRHIFEWIGVAASPSQTNYYDPTSGDFYVRERKVWDGIENSDATYLDTLTMNMGVQVKTLAGSASALEIDYISGWAMRPKVSIIP